MSTAYYALFHLLTHASSKLLVSGAGEGRVSLRNAIRRSYVHGDMKSTALAFASSSPPRVWADATGTISAEIATVADTFVELQGARHDADYDHARQWRRHEAVDLVRRTESAFAAWKLAAGRRDASAFLVALLAKTRRG